MELQNPFFSRLGFYPGKFATLDEELLDPMVSDVDELVLGGKWRRVRMQQLF
jgi:hypothetical protein